MIGRHIPLVISLLAASAPAFPSFAADATAVCLNSGRQYKVGEFACIPACHGQRRLARCDKVAETASWTYVSDACPSALLPPGLLDASARPMPVAMTPIPLPIERLMSEMTPESWMRLTERTRKSAAAAVN